MKKWLAVFLSTLTLAGMARAQSDLVPDALFPIDDLGIALPVPSNWTYRVSNGIYFGASETDLDAVTDGNGATIAVSPVIQVSSMPYESLVRQPDVPLTDVALALAQQLNITIQGEALESSVLGHLAVTLVCHSDQGGIVLTTWTQDDTIVILTLSVADAASVANYGSTWINLLNDITAADALDLTTKARSTYGFEMLVPDRWTVLNLETIGLFGVYELANDAATVQNATSQVLEGATVVVTFNNFADLGLTSSSTPADLLPILTQNLGLSNVTALGEFYVDSQSGVGVRGQLANGRWWTTVATLDMDNQMVLFYVLSTTDDMTMDTLAPTFYAMLHSTNQDLSRLP